MLKYYSRLLRELPTLLLTSTSRVNGVLFLVATVLAAVLPTLTAKWSLTQGPTADWLKAHAASVPAWWPLVPISLLVLLGVFKVNYEFYAKVERQRNGLRAKLDDRAQRHQDAEELGRLRKTMRKRYYEWLEDGARISSVGSQPADERAADERAADERALDVQNQIATLLEERYGFDIADRFLTADNADSPHTFVLTETGEYADRIKRLRSIIRDIRSGRIRRKVKK